MKQCVVVKCSEKHVAKGYCYSHYHAWRKYGDPLKVKKQQARSVKCAVDYCWDKPRANSLCSRHYNSLSKYGSAIYVDVDVFPTSPDPNIKFCAKCLKPKDLSEYWFNSKKKAYHPRCRVCVQEDDADYRLNRQPEHVSEKLKRSSSIAKARKNYGEDGVAVQHRILDGETCEICGGRTTRMAIDHCHDTGKVRGLLCSNCNTALGLLKEDPERVVKLLDYLKTHNEKE